MKGLPAESVQCVVTSPPYWGLRTYGDDGQYGLESTPEEHIAKMVEVFREVRRVLRKDGTVWLNYGDSYAQSTLRHRGGVKEDNRERLIDNNFSTAVNCLKPKDLCMIPARVAIALQADGWWIRSEIIWAKPNPMPESCTDRPTSSHEKIYLLTKSAKYFYDADAVREKSIDPESFSGKRQRSEDVRNTGLSPQHLGVGNVGNTYPLRNLRNVWTISTFPTPDAHFATFPPALVKRCVLAGTSHKACEICNAPWARVVEKGDKIVPQERKNTQPVDQRDTRDRGWSCEEGFSSGTHYDRKTTGFRQTCDCDNEGTGKCVVLDPFMGSGTTAKVAQELGRDWIGIDLGGKDGEYKRIFDKKMQGATIGLF